MEAKEFRIGEDETISEGFGAYPVSCCSCRRILLVQIGNINDFNKKRIVFCGNLRVDPLWCLNTDIICTGCTNRCLHETEVHKP